MQTSLTDTTTGTTPAAVTVSEAVVLPSPTALLTPPVPLEAVRRWLWCDPEGKTTVHRLEDCWYVCTVCGNDIRHVINEAKPMWAIR